VPFTGLSKPIQHRGSLDSAAFEIPENEHARLAGAGPIVCSDRIETDQRSRGFALELRHLRYFVAVAEELHFGHAANRLHTSQSSLSQQIRNLERELKVDLLRRVKRHVELTPAGTRFLLEARGILAAAERAAGLARETAREESKKLVIGISPETDWAFLGRALKLFGEHAPSVEVLFQNLTPEAQIEALHGGRIDIGFVGLPIEAEGIVSEVTGSEHLVAAIPEAHPMARNGPIQLGALSGETYTLWPRHLSPGRYDRLLTIFRRAGFGPPVTMEGGLPSTQTVLGMVAAGLTIALVDPAIKHRAIPGVVFRPIKDRKVSTESGVIYRTEDLSPVLASFLHEVKLTPRSRVGPETSVEEKNAVTSKPRAALVRPRRRR
jgi:DNA-binding transcriptional LysR family regulator